jgi:hypothetical protein
VELLDYPSVFLVVVSVALASMPVEQARLALHCCSMASRWVTGGWLGRVLVYVLLQGDRQQLVEASEELQVAEE